jgi:hypothetical protein
VPRIASPIEKTEGVLLTPPTLAIATTASFDLGFLPSSLRMQLEGDGGDGFAMFCCS